MKIKISKKMAKEVGIDKNEIVMELIDLGERVPKSVTGYKYSKAILIYVKED